MKYARHFIVPFIWFGSFSSSIVPAASFERSVSPSRQFIVYGPSVPLRGAMGDLAERTKASLLEILHKRDDWKTPIILNLQFRQANAPDVPASQLFVSQTGIGLKLQLNLTIPGQVDQRAIRRDLLRAIFIELIYRDHSDIPAGSMYAEAPPWLIEGVLARSAGEQRQTLGDLLTAAAETDKIISVPDLMGQKPEQLDSQARLLYRAYAAALLQLLLDQPAGPSRLSAYIEGLSHGSNDAVRDLKSQFPSLGNSAALDALWKSAVGKFASNATYEFLLSFAETERQLEELLRTPIPNPNGKGKSLELEQLGAAKPVALQVPALRSLGQHLLLLSASAHPFLRPVVVEYQDIAQQLAARNRAKILPRLARVKAIRGRTVARMTEVEDYMNWFEATQLQTSSGDFTNYLKAAGASNEPEKRRRDALSVYLDAVEAQFQN